MTEPTDATEDTLSFGEIAGKPIPVLSMDRRNWTPASAASHLEAFLSPAPADTEPGAEKAAETPAPAEADAAPEAEAEPEESAPPAEGNPDQAEVAEDAPPPPRRLKIPADAESPEEEVTEEEAIRGYLRHRDYTRKRMADAEAEKARASDYEAVRAERQRIAARLKEVEDALAPPTVDWDKVQREHPDQFPTLWANYQRLEAERAKVAQERAEADAKARADWEASMKDRMTKERELLLAAVPEWRDEAKAKADVQALVTYAKSRGFTDQELQVTDHRLMLLLRDAALGASVRTAKPKVTKDVESKIKTVKPGSAGTVKPKVDADVALVDRFQKSGKLRDAAAVFEKLF